MVLSLVCACQFMVILDAAIVNVALPSIRRDLGFTPTGLAWVVNGYLLIFAGFMLLGGRAADLFGHRRILAAGLCLFSASSLAGGLATAPEVLVAARVAQGMGAAMLAPATLAVINTSFTEEHARARAFGAWSASGGVGGMAGAVAGGAITTGLSWRWVFLINVPIGAVLIVVAMMSLAGTRTGRRESLDLTGAVTGTAGLAALIYGVMHSADHGWTSVLVVGPAVAGLLLLVVFTVVEARVATQPMMPLRLFTIRGVAVGNGMLLLFGGIAIAMWYFDGDGVDQPQAGVQPTTGTGGQRQFGQPAAPGWAEQGGQLGDDAQVGQQGMELGLDPGAHPDQPSPGPDQPAGLTGVGWGDPGLGQQVGPQQVGQGLGIHGVVLDPGG